MHEPTGQKLVCGRCGTEHDGFPDGGLRCESCGVYGEPSCWVPDTDGPLCDEEEHENEECFHYA